MLPERWRASVPVVAAVAVVAALSLLTVTVMTGIGGGDDADERSLVDVDGTTEAPRRIAPRPTTTTTGPPQVLGDTTEREADDEPVGAEAPPTTSAPATTGDPVQRTPSPLPPGPAPAPAPAPRPQPGPTTTTTAATPTAPPTTVCRNSTNPSCGPHSWNPEPGPYEVQVVEVATPDAAVAGAPVTFAIDYVDPAGPTAQGACVNWSAPDAVVDISACDVIQTSCARRGPHDPPAPSGERIRVERELVFENPGTYEVIVGGNVATHLADGCESPYTNTFSRTFTIVVS